MRNLHERQRLLHQIEVTRLGLHKRLCQKKAGVLGTSSQALGAKTARLLP